MSLDHHVKPKKDVLRVGSTHQKNTKTEDAHWPSLGYSEHQNEDRQAQITICCMNDQMHKHNTVSG